MVLFSRRPWTLNCADLSLQLTLARLSLPVWVTQSPTADEAGAVCVPYQTAPPMPPAITSRAIQRPILRLRGRGGGPSGSGAAAAGGAGATATGGAGGATGRAGRGG